MRLKKFFYFPCFLAFMLAFASNAFAQSYDSNFYSYNNNSCCCEPSCCWTGFYIGGRAGGGWKRSRVKFKNDNHFDSLGSRYSFRDNGFVGGGALGYNYQWSSIVVGVEGEILGTDFSKTRRNSSLPDSHRFSSRLHWIADAKVRVGWAWDCFLPFITGGWAGGDVRLKLRDTLNDVSSSSSKWVNGWTVGAGVEYKLYSCLSLGIAYEYIQLDYNRRLSCRNCVLAAPRVDHCFRVQTVLFSINYLFNL